LNIKGFLWRNFGLSYGHISDDVVEEKIPGISYVIRMRRVNSGWRMEILLGNRVEESIAIQKVNETNLLKGLKSCFSNLAAPAMDWQLERSVKNLMDRMATITFIETEEAVPAIDKAMMELNENINSLEQKIDGLEQKIDSIDERLKRVEARMAIDTL
jgi:predicted RNase H-like nuclease (RuvC/YqgF family)